MKSYLIKIPTASCFHIGSQFDCEAIGGGSEKSIRFDSDEEIFFYIKKTSNVC